MTTSTGDQDVVDILTTDHHEVLTLLGQIPAAAPDQRRDMADTIIAELMRHAIAEEMYVYPAMKEHLPGGEGRVEHDVEEHQQLTEIMKQLERLDADDASFLQTLGRLEEVLRDHVQDEESDQFPLLRAHLSREQLVEIGTKVEAAKKAAPTRPHPSAPHSALFHKTLGPGVGLVDRIRDKLTGRPNSL
ncbi:hemerythrin domain-containing protein [Blastococcus sp. TF02-09]|uniref:hemerythrin domain-containing protein n=1 Tax=Blastococcus sp. TF02-09 TaxID=2250576 RepID=UPI000DE83DD6|nr:hemerythrin domain-containing protein [Blastococcus sp. TF02-9]RBY81224.1 hemerythrin domain-containing protein [Blastococcus sp. TF02-9]